MGDLNSFSITPVGDTRDVDDSAACTYGITLNESLERDGIQPVDTQSEALMNAILLAFVRRRAHKAPPAPVRPLYRRIVWMDSFGWPLVRGRRVWIFLETSTTHRDTQPRG